MLRQGMCDFCGECCGTVGNTAYVSNWPEALRTWSLDDAVSVCPQLGMFGIENQGDRIGYSQPNGQYRVRGTLYYYVWIPDIGLCKDTSAAHDGSFFDTECPFLLDDPGDGSRPCALVGTGDDGARFKFCRPEEHPTDYVPENDIWDDRSVTQWQADHPNCSYEFVSE